MESPIKEITFEQAKILISDYMKEKSEAYPSDIADDLNLSITVVMDVLKELEKEKKIGVV